MTKALEATTGDLGAVAPDYFTQILNKHDMGAYLTLCTNYASTVTKMGKLEKPCEQDRMQSDTLSESREKDLLDAPKLT